MADLTRGISTTISIVIVIAALAMIFAGGMIAGLLRKLLVNTVLGVAVLVFINTFGSQVGLSLPLNLLTLIVSAVFGLAGVGVMILLTLAGIKI